LAAACSASCSIVLTSSCVAWAVASLAALASSGSRSPRTGSSEFPVSCALPSVETPFHACDRVALVGLSCPTAWSGHAVAARGSGTSKKRRARATTRGGAPPALMHAASAWHHTSKTAVVPRMPPLAAKGLPSKCCVYDVPSSDFTLSCNSPRRRSKRRKTCQSSFRGPRKVSEHSTL